ncbi:MAG TPA: cupin domain-containing protein [Pedococcus sp.]|nr:cupin domain-containing protein [Pedococcus sp.]
MSYPPPLYRGDQGEASAWLRPSWEPADLESANTEVHYLATGATTGGLFGLYRYEMTAARSGPDPHFHRTMSESFYILSGTLRLHDGAGWRDLERGDFAHVPPGGIHGFRNESGEPVSMLLHFAPGAPRESYFEAVAEVARGERALTPEEWTELYRRHDQYMV